MAITINGSTNTLSGVAVGGLPDGIVDTDMIAANAVTAAKSSGLANQGITQHDEWRVSADYNVGTSSTTITSKHAIAAAIGTAINETPMPAAAL